MKETGVVYPLKKVPKMNVTQIVPGTPVEARLRSKLSPLLLKGLFLFVHVRG